MRARIRGAAEARGFSVPRILTHWPEIVGPEIAAACRPVRVSYARQGMGATLTLLTTGAQAPVLEMQREVIRTRVNAAYGYNAVSRVVLTQTAPTGFAEGQAVFAAARAPSAAAPPPPDPAVAARASAEAAAVRDPGLRAALERLGQNIYARGASPRPAEGKAKS
ncbi:DUF721 domain-containing protein [Phaeovulum vinaykumarii]|nr:DUF721 domain-containing protein [Phaeovulum vinaykumarii]